MFIGVQDVLVLDRKTITPLYKIDKHLSREALPAYTQKDNVSFSNENK
jgi:hypothetical protein